MPKISICLPNLNSRRFLPERLDTIFQQTFTDWELVVVDNHSDDGAWEYFQGRAAQAPRMRISQAPREGMYANWNNCIRQARGEYIYIATSDDTMAPDCLEKLAAALERHPDCDLAHCALRAIGDGAEQVNRWWAKDSLFVKSASALANRRHIRRAPFDGLLHLCGATVYISITQLLIRRTLFDRVGFFDGQWGSIGDFHWAMKAGLMANTAHVPETWGGWRRHAAQATALARCGTAAHRQKIQEMIDDAIQSVDGMLPHHLKVKSGSSWRDFFFSRWLFQRRLEELPTRLARARFLLREMTGGSRAAWSYFGRRLLGSPGWNRSRGDIVIRWLKQAGVANNLQEA